MLPKGFPYGREAVTVGVPRNELVEFWGFSEVTDEMQT